MAKSRNNEVSKIKMVLIEKLMTIKKYICNSLVAFLKVLLKLWMLWVVFYFSFVLFLATQITYLNSNFIRMLF